MDKNILVQYSDAKARVKLIRIRRDNNQKKLNRLNQSGYYVTDSVTCGKRGKKPLKTVIIAGFPYPERDEISEEITKQDLILGLQEQKLLHLQTDVEEYISGIRDIKVQNLMTLYYLEDLNWIQVAHWMNELYPNNKKPYTSDSCRCKHDRFLEKT